MLSWMLSKQDEPEARLGALQDASRFRIDGRKFFVDGEPLHMKGICWSPIPLGGVDPNDIDYDGYADGDSDLMVEAGINVIRVYSPILNHTTLDTFHSKGIHVINMAYVWGGAPVSDVPAIINAVKDHPAIIAWEVGNEWNYNYFYWKPDGSPQDGEKIKSYEEARQRAIDVVATVKEHDTVHPVVTVYGEIPSQEDIDLLDQVDIWAINSYRGIDFTNLFDDFAALTDKPMYLGEYGADAYDNNSWSWGENQTAQAEATTVLTEQIIAQSSLTGGPCLGGLIFEFCDEWWKAPGTPTEHDIGGIAPGGGPYPDGTFNEEWWGLLEIDRTPRLAWEAYKAIAIPVAPPFPQWIVWAGVVILALVAIGCFMANRNQSTESGETEMPQS